jgi:hypothetical protein
MRTHKLYRTARSGLFHSRTAPAVDNQLLLHVRIEHLMEIDWGQVHIVMAVHLFKVIAKFSAVGVCLIAPPPPTPREVRGLKFVFAQGEEELRMRISVNS